MCAISHEPSSEFTLLNTLCSLVPNLVFTQRSQSRRRAIFYRPQTRITVARSHFAMITCTRQDTHICKIVFSIERFDTVGGILRTTALGYSILRSFSPLGSRGKTCTIRSRMTDSWAQRTSFGNASKHHSSPDDC